MLKRPNNEMEAAAAAAMEGIQQDLDEARRSDARKAKARELIMPTDAEDAAITAAALDDPDAQPLTDEQLEQLKPARRGRGRPAQDVTKALVSIRVDAVVLDSFRATGEGWQTRMNSVLRSYLEDNNMVMHRYRATVQARGNELERVGDFMVVAMDTGEAKKKVKQHLRACGREDDARGEVYTIEMGSAVMRDLPLIV